MSDRVKIYRVKNPNLRHAEIELERDVERLCSEGWLPVGYSSITVEADSLLTYVLSVFLVKLQIKV